MVTGYCIVRARSGSPRRSASPTCSRTGRDDAPDLARRPTRTRRRSASRPAPARERGRVRRRGRRPLRAHAIGQCLRRGVPGSMRAAAMLFGGRTQDAWAEILHSVRTGEPGFARVFGEDSFSYMTRHPEWPRSSTRPWRTGPGRVAVAPRPPMTLALPHDHRRRRWQRHAACRHSRHDHGPARDRLRLAARGGPRDSACLAELGLSDRCTAKSAATSSRRCRAAARRLPAEARDPRLARQARNIEILEGLPPRDVPGRGDPCCSSRGVYPPRIDQSMASQGRRRERLAMRRHARLHGAAGNARSPSSARSTRRPGSGSRGSSRRRRSRPG
jgi:hypothetical protein